MIVHFPDITQQTFWKTQIIILKREFLTINYTFNYLV